MSVVAEETTTKKDRNKNKNRIKFYERGAAVIDFINNSVVIMMI